MITDKAANWMVKGDVLANYLEACKTADLSNFKRDPRLTAIFEHSTVKQGEAYFDHVINTNAALLNKVFTNDLVGNPILHRYHNLVVAISPSTLQYIAVLANLIELCGTLDGLRIVEVGGGYGGQCRTIYDVFNPAVYHIIDLPEVCELQSKYLTNKRQYISTPIIIDQQYDLFISNYALSEIPDNGQYIELASRCKHGYITCNTDFVKLPWKHDRRPDITNEPNNYILSW